MTAGTERHAPSSTEVRLVAGARGALDTLPRYAAASASAVAAATRNRGSLFSTLAMKMPSALR
jgi:hypothetical protein